MSKSIFMSLMVAFVLITIHFNNVLAQPPHQEIMGELNSIQEKLDSEVIPPQNEIIQKIDILQNTLDNEVLPKLEECPECPECPEIGVPKTGQTTSYQDGDDGDFEMGIPWPDPRFTDHGDGTVTDNLTGLIWLKNANCFGQRYWETALTDSNTLSSGECGLLDGSSAGDWRLPNVRELFSLIDFGQYNFACAFGKRAQGKNFVAAGFF